MAYGGLKGRELGGACTSRRDGSTVIDGNYENTNL